MRELERKFTTKNNHFIKEAFESYTIEQFFIANGNNSIRVTNRNGEYSIVVKSAKEELNRYECHCPITKTVAEELKERAIGKIIKKTRYLVLSGEGLIWEIDVFKEPIEGLTLAEIELPNVDYEIELPEWIDKEVTGNPFYYNSNLCN